MVGKDGSSFQLRSEVSLASSLLNSDQDTFMSA
jgi:hypothetical protein